MNHNVTRAIMSCHRFPQVNGHYYPTGDGTYEVNYFRTQPGKVRMFAKGNCGHYEHDSLDWLS